MGASIWLIFLFPIFMLIALFGNLSAAITGASQAEIILPYDESNGTVWEYDNQNDYYLDLIEVKVENDEQIFLFKSADGKTSDDQTGRCMDLVFEDKNGNKKTYYAEFSDFGELNFYDESECLITEYTATVHNSRKGYSWVSDGYGKYRVLVKPISCNDTEKFTVVCMPDDIEALETSEGFAFSIGFDYVDEDGYFKESVTVVYELKDGQLKVKDELWTIVHDD